MRVGLTCGGQGLGIPSASAAGQGRLRAWLVEPGAEPAGREGGCWKGDEARGLVVPKPPEGARSPDTSMLTP